MLSRRDILIAAAAGTAAFGRRAGAQMGTSGSVAPAATPVNFAVPPGACDSHTHVIRDPRRFPLSPSRTYTPEQAPVDSLRALHRALHIARVVIVQPSVYGTDNACTLDALRQLGPAARGIAVVDDKTSPAVLDEMDAAGIRGLR